MAPHSSTLAWKIPWTEKPGRLQTMGSLRVGHNWATSLSLFTFHFHALEKEMATHSSVLPWRIPGTVEPGELLSVGWHRVRHDWSNLAAAAAAAWSTHLLSFLSFPICFRCRMTVERSTLNSLPICHVVLRGFDSAMAPSWLLSTSDGPRPCSSSSKLSSPCKTPWITAALSVR